MEAVDLARSLQSRVPWAIASKLFGALEISKSQGWENTLARMASDDPLPEEVVRQLSQALTDHILYGEKLVRFYRLQRHQAESLREHLAELANPSGSMAEKFPLLLTGAELAAYEPLDPVVVGKVIDPEGTSLVFGAARSTAFRVPLDVEMIPVEARSYFSGYSELLGIKTVRIQTLDAIVVDNEQPLVEVRCDFPEGMTGEGVAVSIAHASKYLQEVLGAELEPINLFPAMGRMFRSQDEGTVAEAAFTTQSASIKHEKMRRRRYSLREEPYHKAGREAVDDALEVFKLAVRWDVPINEKLSTLPEAFFSSSVRSIGGKQPPTLYDVGIYGCVGRQDYEFTRGRILSYV